MWLYKINTGKLFQDDTLVWAFGYSGFGPGKNQPSQQNAKGLGPLPAGSYEIGEPRDVDKPGPHGPFVLPLTPSPLNHMYGRGDFLFHGDAKEHLGEASHGCIIVPRDVREKIAASKDKLLIVVSGMV